MTALPQLAEMTFQQLADAPVGQPVRDCEGDVWYKRQDGRWQWSRAKLETESLVEIFGPVRYLQPADDALPAPKEA